MAENIALSADEPKGKRMVKLVYLRSADEARAVGRMAYGGDCVIEGLHRSSLRFLGPLDGAHIFSVKMAPEIQACPLNILPICRYRHNNPFGFFPGDTKGCMDLVGRNPRPHIERIEWLLRWLWPDYRRRAIEQMQNLFELVLPICEGVRKIEDDLTVMLEAA